MSDKASLGPQVDGRSRDSISPVWLAATSGGSRIKTIEWVLIAGITLAALLLRVFRLGELPPGLHIDEAFNILDARAVVDGWRPVFLPANAGRDVLYTYIQAPLLAMLGESAASARLASALAGTLTVPVAWGFVRSLPVPRAQRVALLTAAFTALSYWHLHFSRFGIRAVVFPLIVTLVMWAWWKAVNPQSEDGRDDKASPVAIVICGALLGLAAYVHPAGRFLFVVPALHAGYLAIRTRTLRPVAVAAGTVIVAALVVLPLARHWMLHPDSFTGHAQEVSVLGTGLGELTALAANGLKVAAMFNVAGDPAGWRNLISGQTVTESARAIGAAPETLTLLRGRPVFDVLTGLLFLAGLAVLVRATFDRKHWAALILIWIGVLLVPTVVTDAAPNFSRAIGIIPAVLLAPALALDLLAKRVADRWERIAGVALIAVVVLWAGAVTVRDYFVVWAHDLDTPIAFDADKVALAQYLNESGRDGSTVYLSPSMADHPTVKVAAVNTPRGFDPSHGLVVAGTDVTTTQYVFPTDDPAWAALGAQLGEALHTAPLGSRLGYRLAVEGVAGLDAVGTMANRSQVGTVVLPENLPAEPTALRLRLAEPMIDSDEAFAFGDVASLVSSSTSPMEFVQEPAPATATPVLTTTVMVVWHVRGGTAHDLSVMVHLNTPDGQVWGVGDGGPVGGSYPTSRWQQGELVFDTHVIVADPAPPPGAVEIVVGLYDWRTGERLPVSGPAAQLRENGTAAAVATVQVINDVTNFVNRDR